MAGGKIAGEEVMPWKKDLPPKRSEPASWEVEVDTLDWEEIDESGRRQYHATMTSNSNNAPDVASHVTFIWDDRGQGVPHPGQRFRITLDPLD
jgi:hypothetical protein